jgi:crotonobetaine/carnitine-CoA ligase
MSFTRTFLAALESQAESNPGHQLVRFLDQESYTAADLLMGAARAASVLSGAGARPGDRIAVLVDNRVEFLWALLGASHMGAVSVPLNVNLRGAMLAHQLRQTTPSVVVAVPESTAAASAALTEVGHPAVILETGSHDDANFARRIAAAPEAPRAKVAESDLFSIMYTSGTTGPSKGIMLSGSMAIAFAESAQEVLRYDAGDVAYTCLPLYHANALLVSLLAAILYGASATIGPRFSASHFWNEVSRSSATLISLLGAMLPILLAKEPSSTEIHHCVRLALSTPMPAQLTEPFQDRFGMPLTSLYGLTDLGVPIGVPFGVQPKPGRCGVALPGWRCRIVNESGTEVPAAERGELVARPLRRDRTQLGYWHDDGAGAAAWHDGWFRTGDILVRERDGWFRFVDRQKDAIRRFGENISSSEVETVLLMHPAIAEAAVYAIPSELSEDEVMAAVVLRAGSSVSHSDIAAYCSAQMPYFAVPRYIDVRSELPKTPTAKVQKDLLRRDGLTATTWDGGRPVRPGRQ